MYKIIKWNNFFKSIIGTQTKVMVGSSRKEDILFTVSALSNGLYDNEEDRHATIGDAFLYSNTEAEMDNECNMHILSLFEFNGILNRGQISGKH